VQYQGLVVALFEGCEWAILMSGGDSKWKSEESSFHGGAMLEDVKKLIKISGNIKMDVVKMQ